MATFAKPESALKRAEELINVGQKQEALQALHDLITSRRYRAWTKTHERIMFKYVELCVDMRRGRFAKDGLIQYRSVCQQVNISSLEEVIKHFMHLATERAELARSQAQALEEALNVEDLEADKRPEDLMLSYVSGEKGKDRSDRELVTPWFKFLWETYRTVLEILRNNSKLEALYAMTAHRAFQFCKQYKRTTELRRLCEIIRNHLANLNKFRDQRDRPDLSAPESLQLYLDTRIEQLKVSTELGLWQEAFRSIEDIYGLMCMVKKTPKPSLMVVYYGKLTEIFWMSSNHLYHAYAWLKLFFLQKSFNKNLSQKDLQLIASSVVLAALSVSPYDKLYGASHLELENEKERSLRVANLIGFDVEPRSEKKEVFLTFVSFLLSPFQLSRSSILSELVSRGVMVCVTQEVKDLYHLLEREFLPLDLALKVQPLLNKILKLGGKLSSAASVPEVQLSQYVPALEKLATLRLLQQVSQVYQTIQIGNLSKMIPFFDLAAIEKISVDAVRHNFVAIKVDHLSGSVLFGKQNFYSIALCATSGFWDTGMWRQSIEAEGLRDHLSLFAESLSKARLLIYPPAKKVAKLGDALSNLAEIVEKEHKRLLARKSIIEKRKEEQERLLLEKERVEESKRREHQKMTEEAEQKRVSAELEQRRNQRILKEIEDRELEEAQAMLQEAEKRSKRKKKPVLDGEKMTKKDIMELALHEQLRERQEMEKKLQKFAKIMDYLERAKSEEAAPLIESAFQRHLAEEATLHEREQQQEIELSRQRHAGDLLEKRRLGRMLENERIFQERLVGCREAEFNSMKQERQERINQIIQTRKQDRDTRRKLIFFLQKEEEQQKRLQEEEDARKHEEAEKRKREEADRKAKLDAIAEKQRQRELELEEKKRLEREEVLGKSMPVSLDPSTVGRPSEAGATAPAATAAAPTPGKFLPRFRREKIDVAGQAPPPETDRWSSGGRRDERNSFGGGSRTSWSSSRRN
ncbi:hypothetical protein RDI58_025345 [Solanum bulbocastanum]|uniref:Eukaryotic translation initiation factor 3 subunit A n=1 Tax=Solanum bulbocastanum TaxID=147425 RepID=A0AAN8T405_SOLBU